MGWGSKHRGAVGVAALATVALLAPPASLAGAPTKPRNGTYSGVGNMVGNPNHWVQVAFTLKGGVNVDPEAGIYQIPGCSGGFSVPATTLGPNRFETTASNPNQEENTITGRWVSNSRIRGKVVIDRPNAASCGDPGRYVFKYKGKRYGRP